MVRPMIIKDCRFEGRRYWSPYGSVAPPVGWPDDSRYGNDGVDTGATWVQIPSGLWVKDFDGVNDHTQLTNTITFVGASISFWLFRSSNGATQWALDNRDGASAGAGYLYIINGTLVITLSAGTSYVNAVASVTSIEDTWHQIVVTGITLTPGGGANPELTIGSRCNFIQATNGHIAQFKVYSYVLTLDQINANYASERYWFDGA